VKVPVSLFGLNAYRYDAVISHHRQLIDGGCPANEQSRFSGSRSKMNKKVKVFIVDDHPIVREGLVLRINRQPEMVVCGEASNRAEAMNLISASQPDVAIVDLVLEDGNGLELVRDMAARHPEVPVLVFSIQDERIYAQRSLQAGAKGYIMKNEIADKVVEALQRILSGHVYLSAAMSADYLDSLAAYKKPTPSSPLESFSNRELEIFRLLGEGLNTRSIATQLHISVSTIHTYCERIKLRLKVETLDELRQRALLWKHGH
jgi:DNA-binding NarL/FixJ family response regulator